jgi:hypothetical protein
VDPRERNAEAQRQVYGSKNFLANLRIAVALAARIKSSFPGPLRNRFNYLKSVMPGEALTAVKKVTEQ